MLDAVSLLGQKVIAYRPILRAAGIASTTNGALLASQLLYHYQQSGRQAFHITDLELSAELGLTVKEIRGARADLVKRLGAAAYFSYEVRGFNRQAFWDVDADRIGELMHTSRETSRDALSPHGANASAPSDRSADAQVPQRANASAPRGETKRPTGRMQVPHGANDLYTRELKKEKEEVTALRAREPEPEPAPKAKRSQPFKPSPTDVPPELQAVASELLDFWTEKRGARTSRAWAGLLTELVKIAQDMHGGTETVRTQLNAAVQAGWQSVTYANWQRYGKPAKPFGNGTAPRYASRAERQRTEIEQFCAFMDAHSPDAQQAPPLTTVNLL